MKMNRLRNEPGAQGRLVTTHTLKRILRHPAIGGSAALFAGAIIAGIVNYLFNVILARESFLGTIDYGTLAALMSMLSLVALIGQTISTVTANYTASFVSQDKKDSVGKLIRALKIRIYRYGVPSLILFAGFSRLIAHFLHIESPLPILMLIPLALLSLLSQTIAGGLQGILAFGYLALAGVGGTLLRLILAVLAVLAGYRVLGVLLASVVSQFIIYRLTHIPLRPYLTGFSSKQVLPRKDIIKYTGPVFIALIGITSFFSMDVILAKHFLSANNAGIYSGIALLARIVYFASMPFVHVMFPIASQHVSRKKSTRSMVLLTLGAVLSIAVVTNTVYFLFPNYVISWSIGSSYLAGKHVLGLMALTLSSVSTSAWLIHFLLAHRDSRASWILPTCAVVQAVLIIFFHDTLEHIVLSSLAASSLLIVSLVLYILWWTYHHSPTRKEHLIQQESTPMSV